MLCCLGQRQRFGPKEQNFLHCVHITHSSLNWATGPPQTPSLPPFPKSVSSPGAPHAPDDLTLNPPGGRRAGSSLSLSLGPRHSRLPSRCCHSDVLPPLVEQAPVSAHAWRCQRSRLRSRPACPLAQPRQPQGRTPPAPTPSPGSGAPRPHPPEGSPTQHHAPPRSPTRGDVAERIPGPEPVTAQIASANFPQTAHRGRGDTCQDLCERERPGLRLQGWLRLLGPGGGTSGTTGPRPRARRWGPTAPCSALAAGTACLRVGPHGFSWGQSPKSTDYEFLACHSVSNFKRDREKHTTYRK